MYNNPSKEVRQKESTDNIRHKFLIHHKEDDVGVVTIPIKEGEQVIGIYMEDNSEVNIKANHDIPLGHKISLKEFEEGQPVTEYSIKIGDTATKWAKGDYVHTHNIKTARW